MNPIFSAILGPLLDIGRGFFDDWKAKREGERAVQAAVVQNRIRLAESAQTHNQAWEMAALEGRDNAMRRVSFVLWVWPLVWGYFDADGLRAYFLTLTEIMPEWYVYGFLGVNAAIWGLSTLKDVRGSFVRIPVPQDAPGAPGGGSNG